MVDVAIVWVEQPPEHQSDGNGGGYIGKEVDRLKQSLSFAQRVDKQGASQRQDNRNRNADKGDDQCVAYRRPKGWIL